MQTSPSYSNDHSGLAALIRLYAIAGDKKSEEGKAQQEKVASAIRSAKRLLSKHVGKVVGTFSSLEWRELLDEYAKAMKGLVKAGDADLPNIYRENLNTLLANKDKRLQFIRERLKPTPAELEQLDGLLLEDIVNTGAYVRHRDMGLMEEDLWHWEAVRAANSQIGSIIETLIGRRRDGHESDNSTFGKGGHEYGHDGRQHNQRDGPGPR
jgi:hypothetical protein